MSERVKIGIIGTGQIGKMHIQRYKELPEADIVAVSDINIDEANRVAAENNIPHVFKDYNQLLAMHEVGAVDVCVHNRLHACLTIDALRAGKHVFCEKPMAATYAEARSMYDEAIKQDRKLSIQLGRLFSPSSKSAMRLIADGNLGKLYYAKSCSYRRRGRPFVDGYGAPAFVNTQTSGGGTLLDMAVYHISQTLYLLGNPKVQTVTAATYDEIEMYPDRRSSSGYDVEELGVGFIRLAGGVSFFIEEAWAIHSDRAEGVSIFGNLGGIRIAPNPNNIPPGDGVTFFSTISDMEMTGTFDLGSANTRWHRCDPSYRGYDSPQAHWVCALLGIVPLLDTAGIALNTALITEGLYRSSQLGREVTVDEIQRNTSDA